MGESLKNYWQFMNRSPSLVQTTGIQEHLTIWHQCALSSVFFCVLCVIIPPITRFLLPKFYESMNEQKRREYPTYLSCLVHHFVVVPFAVSHIYMDTLRTNESQWLHHNYASTDGYIVAYTFGYMVADIIFFAISEALKGEFEFLFHHILSLALVVSTLLLPGPTNRFVPHVLLCELSQLFFVTAWFLRLAGCTYEGLILALEVVFVVMFFLTRIINLPIAVLKILGMY
jgi:hypothetical protein